MGRFKRWAARIAYASEGFAGCVCAWGSVAEGWKATCLEVSVLVASEMLCRHRRGQGDSENCRRVFVKTYRA